MLRKRTRSQLKDPQMAQLTGGDTVSESKFYSFFNILTSKAVESDSARSPTSPLDFQLFSNLSNHFRSPKSPNEGHRKTWFRNKVGLGIVDSPDFKTEQSGKVLRASDSKNIIFGIKTLNSSQNFIGAPKSLPNARASDNNRNTFDLDSAVKVRSFSFEYDRSRSNLDHLSKGSRSFLGYKGSVSENDSELAIGKVPNTTQDSDSMKQKSPVIESVGSANHLIANIQPNEIELSEDYTCVRVHGPNPKVTHIFCDCILTCHENNTNTFVKKEDGDVVVPQTVEIFKCPLYPPNDFLSLCYSCNKSLDGEDIYMYRGEKAFCSENCRLQEILIDEEMEKINEDKCQDFANPINDNNKGSSESRWFIST